MADEVDTRQAIAGSQQALTSSLRDPEMRMVYLQPCMILCPGAWMIFVRATVLNMSAAGSTKGSMPRRNIFLHFKNCEKFELTEVVGV